MPRRIDLQIEPELLTGKHVMVVAHANSLRSMIMYLDKLTSKEVRNQKQFNTKFFHMHVPQLRFICFIVTGY
jgi:bisphosphoglycerate-dependent phosphoglycerate mutase